MELENQVHESVSGMLLHAKMKQFYPDHELTDSEWKEELAYYQNRKENGDFEPFCTVAIYYIENYML